MTRAAIAKMRQAALLGRPEPDQIRLTLPEPPSTNRMWRTNRYGKTYLTPEAKAYKERVSLIFLQEDISGPFRGPVSFTVEWYRRIKRGDLSNRIKVLEDALIGLAWIDDDQVTILHAYRYEDKDNPRVEVIISPLDRG